MAEEDQADYGFGRNMGPWGAIPGEQDGEDGAQ